ncbi:MAG TPA: glycosyltransferase family 4 protein [Caldisericia bacterium]|nr:glycosyltransferase family 4 protein [Caldisericia bacterium]HOP95752.1 glycosyltransferase family 4 protein [Dictyoglomaceae bacterium]HPU44119.1 glycosyltransferase family 4 protein [Dictyoglomaceae bacterium]
MLKIAYLSDFPFSIGFGGKEVAMLSYLNYINSCSSGVEIDLMDFFNKDQSFDILHLFGYSNWFYDIVKNLRANTPNIKIVISPTFYYANETKMEIAAFFSRFCILPNFFSYKRFFLENVDMIIVNSKTEKEQIKKLFKISDQKFRVIYNFVNSRFPIFEKDENRDLFLKTYKLEKENYLLNVSFIDERKNTLNLIKAFLEIYPVVKMKLVIIGSFRFRDYKKRKELEVLINDNKDKIVYIPFLERESDLLKSAYLNCRAHLLPSFLETPGLSNLEAAIFKRPILVGECKPVKEYFEEHAIYCNPYDIKSIRNGILKVIEQNSSESLYSMVINKYSEKQAIPGLIKLYKELSN